MRFTSLSLTALSVSVALGLCVAGCKEDRAESAYHPSPSAWYGYNPSSVDGTHAAQSPNIAPKVLDEGAPAATEGEALPGTTRATANVGGTGGGPSNGGDMKPEHKGHFGQTAGTTDDGTKPVSRTGK